MDALRYFSRHLLGRPDLRNGALVLMMWALLTQNSLSQPQAVVDSFPTPASCPTGLTWDGRYLWVADRKADSLYQVDPLNGKLRAALPSPGFWPMGLTWDGSRLWNVDSEDREIYEIDPQKRLVLRSLPAPCPQPVGLTWDGQHLLISDIRESKIYRVSLEDGTVVSSFPSPFSAPTGLCFDGNYLWVSDRGKDEIYMTTPEEGEVVVAFPSPGPYANGLAWDGEHLWNADYQSDRIYRIELRKDEQYSSSEDTETLVEYTQEFRNYGPGKVASVDFYLAIPEDSPHQQLLADIEYDPPPDGVLNDRWGRGWGTGPSGT